MLTWRLRELTDTIQALGSNYFFVKVTISVLLVIIGYIQSVTGCGSQLRHVVVTQRKLI